MKILFAFLLSILSANAATYYIDYNAANDAANGTSKSTPWKRVPGMRGFAGSYSHVAGDRFIFKGGVTWPSVTYPWVVGWNGSSGNHDTYTTDQTWFNGASWSQPTFDAGGTRPTGGILSGENRRYLTFNDLKFINMGTSGVSDGTKAIDFLDSQDLTFNGLTLRTYNWIAMYVHVQTPGVYSNFTFSNIDCANTSSLLWFTSNSNNTTRNNVRFFNNTIHDFASQIGGGVHGDGFWHSFTVPSFQADQQITNLEFYNNYAYGDFRRSFGTDGGMTAFFFLEDCVSGKIYNNVFAPDADATYEGFIVGTAVGPAQLEYYNNVLIQKGTDRASAGFSGGAYNANSKVTLKNNIITGFRWAVTLPYVAGTVISDYNLFNSANAQLVYNGNYQSYATWQAAGRDVNGRLGVNPLVAANGSLNAGSPAIGAGVNLSSVFTTDITGRTRTVPWDMGAYAYTGTIVKPAAPVNLRLVP